MVFRIKMSLLHTDGTNVNYENGTQSFSNGIDYYSSAIAHAKGAILWGQEVIEARIEFWINTERTELTHLRLGKNAELETRIS